MTEDRKYNISAADVSESDISQEAWLIRLETKAGQALAKQYKEDKITEAEYLLELEKIPVNKATVAKKMKSGLPLNFDNAPPNISTGEPGTNLSYEDICRLLDWAEENDCIDEVDEFLANGDLKKLSAILSARGILLKKQLKAVKTPQTSILDFIMRMLSKGPETYMDILEAVSSTHTDSKRPDAACRRALTKGIDKGFIKSYEDESHCKRYMLAERKYNN